MSQVARYHHRRPLDRATYDRVRAAMARGEQAPSHQGTLPVEGVVVSLAAGDVLTLTLIEGPQIVHLYAWNAVDPDERIWTNETSSKEDAFLTIDHRIWGTMARFRPLLTVVEDTVRSLDRPGEPVGRHHCVLGGWETPAAWAAGGGDPSVPSAWGRMRDLLTDAGVDPQAYRDHISLFQKIAVEPETQRFNLVESDARPGDRLSLFAEIDLHVALVPSPYREGGVAPAELDGSVRRVRHEVRLSGVRPPVWPYPVVRYPDLAPYVDETGRRTA